MTKNRTSASRERVPPSKQRCITLNDYLNGIAQATTVTELENAIRVPYKHSYHGRIWTRICRARISQGIAICDAHPLGRFVPRFQNRGRVLTVCGEDYRVGRGYNSTGISYVWHFAQEWASTVMLKNGLTARAAYHVWQAWRDYPHRCLTVIERAMAGSYPDRPLNRLRLSHLSSAPLSYTLAQNDADEFDRRATRPCRCGGTRFDWGAAYTGTEYAMNWHCNGCRRVYVEFMTDKRLGELRRPPV